MSTVYSFEGEIQVDYQTSMGDRWIVVSENPAIIPREGEWVEGVSGTRYKVLQVRRGFYDIAHGGDTLEVTVKVQKPYDSDRMLDEYEAAKMSPRDYVGDDGLKK